MEISFKFLKPIDRPYSFVGHLSNGGGFLAMGKSLDELKNNSNTAFKSIVAAKALMACHSNINGDRVVSSVKNELKKFEEYLSKNIR